MNENDIRYQTLGKEENGFVIKGIVVVKTLNFALSKSNH